MVVFVCRAGTGLLLQPDLNRTFNGFNERTGEQISSMIQVVTPVGAKTWIMPGNGLGIVRLGISLGNYPEWDWGKPLAKV